MHIPGKPLMRPKQSQFSLTDARRLAHASEFIRRAVDPLTSAIYKMMAARIVQGIGRTTTKISSNQGKIRRARRQAWAAGDRLAFAA